MKLAIIHLKNIGILIGAKLAPLVINLAKGFSKFLNELIGTKEKIEDLNLSTHPLVIILGEMLILVGDLVLAFKDITASKEGLAAAFGTFAILAAFVNPVLAIAAGLTAIVTAMKMLMPFSSKWWAAWKKHESDIEDMPENVNRRLKLIKLMTKINKRRERGLPTEGLERELRELQEFNELEGDIIGPSQSANDQQSALQPTGAPAGAMAKAGGVVQNNTINIAVNGASGDPRQIAQQIRKELDSSLMAFNRTLPAQLGLT